MYKFITIGFIIVGLCAILGALYLAYDTQKKIETWVDVEGTVVDVEVVWRRSSNGPGLEYHVEVTYKYEFGGKTYENTISPGGFRNPSEKSTIKEAASYVIGSTRRLSANPSNPHQISHPLGYNLGTFAGVLISFGLGLVFLVLGILLWKPPKLKVNINFLMKFLPITFILIGIGFVAGASIAYINDSESLAGPIFFWIFGLFFIVIPTLNLINQARGTVKTEVGVSLGKSRTYTMSEANGVADVLYSPAKKHTNTEEQFLREVARFGAREMDKIGSRKNIKQINIWVEGWIPLQDGSGQLAWKGVRLTLNKESWRGPIIGDLSNLAALDQWQYFRHCSFAYISESEFPKWPKPSGAPA